MKEPFTATNGDTLAALTRDMESVQARLAKARADFRAAEAALKVHYTYLEEVVSSEMNIRCRLETFHRQREEAEWAAK